MAKCACPSWWERYFLCKNRMLVYNTFIKNLACPNLICMVYGNIIMQTKYESSLSHNKIRMLHVAFSIKRARASHISWSWEIFNKEEYIYTMVVKGGGVSYLIQSSFFYFQMYQIITIGKTRNLKTLNTYVYLPIGSIYLLIFFVVLIIIRRLVNWQHTKKSLVLQRKLTFNVYIWVICKIEACNNRKLYLVIY